MSNKLNCKIFITHEEKERPLALALNDFINESLNHKIDISLQRISLKTLTSKSIILVLCSPYSISGSLIHYESGAASFLGPDNNSNLSVIPICHSGLSTAELPYYLSSSQGIILNVETTKDKTVQKKKLNEFGDELLKSIKRELNISNICTTNDFYEYWLNAWQTIESNKYSHKHKIDHKVSHMLFSITRDKEENYRKLYINKTQKTTNEYYQDNQLRSLSLFLSDKCDKLHTSATFGIQPFLWDGKYLYVGLNKIHSTNRSVGLYDFGIEIVDINNTIHGITNPYFPLLEKCKKVKTWFLNEDGVHKQAWYNCIIKRLESINSSLWYISTTTYNTQEYPSIILLNDSDNNPRLDICLLKVIDISNTDFISISDKYIKNREVYKTQNSLDLNINDSNLSYYDWIWARDGKIEYWYYVNSKEIPRNQYVAPVEGHTFINYSALMNHYAYFSNITPYASDEEIREGNVLTDAFTTPARQLLTIF